MWKGLLPYFLASRSARARTAVELIRLWPTTHAHTEIHWRPWRNSEASIDSWDSPRVGQTGSVTRIAHGRDLRARGRCHPMGVCANGQKCVARSRQFERSFGVEAGHAHCQAGLAGGLADGLDGVGMN